MIPLTIWSSLLESTVASSRDRPYKVFLGQRFTTDDIGRPLAQLRAPKESLLNIIQVEVYTPAVADLLECIFPGFAPVLDLLKKVVENGSSGQSFSTIPRSYKRAEGFRCLMNHPFVSDSNLVGFLPIAIWISPPSATKLPTEKSRVFIICTSSAVCRLLDSHYDSAYTKRWTRFQKDHLWIFTDLLHIFREWGQVWNTTKRNIAKFQRQIHDSARTMPLLDLTQALHSEMAKVLSAREQLRVHASTTTRFAHLDKVTAVQIQAERAQEHLEDIEFHEETSQVLLRQLENMTSLAFNIETMTQGQAVARLNVLAFAFLPVSWVASIFGMTNFSLWAFTILLLVVLVPLVLPVNMFYRYILGPSVPNWIRPTGLLPSTKASENNSSVESPSPKYGLLSSPQVVDCPDSVPIHRDVGVCLPLDQGITAPGQGALRPPSSSSWNISHGTQPAGKTFEIFATEQQSCPPRKKIQDRSQKEGTSVSADIEAQNQSSME